MSLYGNFMTNTFVWRSFLDFIKCSDFKRTFQTSLLHWRDLFWTFSASCYPGIHCFLLPQGQLRVIGPTMILFIDTNNASLKHLNDVYLVQRLIFFPCTGVSSNLIAQQEWNALIPVDWISIFPNMLRHTQSTLHFLASWASIPRIQSVFCGQMQM